MSIKLMTMAWENDQTKGSERLVLLALADSANDECSCWPAYSTIARKANISRIQAIRHIKTLCNKGLISKEHRTDPKKPAGNRQTSNMYTIHSGKLGVSPTILPSITDDTPVSVTHDTPPVSPMIPKSSIEPTIEPPDNHTLPILSKWAELFPDKPQPRSTTKWVQRKVKSRMKEKQFVEKWKEAMIRASKSPTLQEESWFDLAYFLRNEETYIKCFNRFMEWKDKKRKGYRPGGNGRERTEEEIVAEGKRLAEAEMIR